MEIQLFLPPAMGAIVFVLGWNIQRAAAGTVSRSRLRLLAAYTATLTIACYGIVWQDEIKAAWEASPLLISAAGLGAVAAVIFVIVVMHEKSDADLTLGSDYATQSVSNAKRSLARRIFAWVVIIWGLAGLVGGVAAIIFHSSAR